MKLDRSIIVSKTVRIFLSPTAQVQSTTPIDLYTVTLAYVTIGTTSSLIDVILHTASYTIDVNGKIDVLNIFMYMFTNNDTNARSKIQISGDGGNTFVDMTDDIPDGLDIITIGPGLWISNIQAGENKLQIRILGKSTDGNPANIKIGGDAYIEMTLSKKII